MITIKQSGDFKRVTGWLERIKEIAKLGILDKYGRKGVEALSSATPVDSGLTAASWSYEIQNDGKFASIVFNNSNVNRGVNIAIILQTGHGTGTGGWVQGRDYINPAIQPIFDQLAEEAWKEVTRV
jgi:hypothetical protein